MTTKTRTDVHRPSSPDFDPESYDFIACGDNGTSEERPYPPTWAYKALRDAGHGPYAYATSAVCTHCGAALRYYALMLHRPTGEWVYVGETCLDNRFDLSKGEFQKLREASKLNRERSSKADKIAKLIEQHPGLVWATYLYDMDLPLDAYKWDSALCDITDKFLSKGELSDAQIALVLRKIEDKFEFVAKRDAQKALQAAEKAAGKIVPVVEGRQVITGTVLSVKPVPNDFGYHGGTTWKMTVQDERGFKVYGTVAASIDDSLREVQAAEVANGGEYGDYVDALKGRKVTFTAKVVRSEKDEFFGYYSRPTKGQIVSE